MSVDEVRSATALVQLSYAQSSMITHPAWTLFGRHAREKGVHVCHYDVGVCCQSSRPCDSEVSGGHGDIDAFGGDFCSEGANIVTQLSYGHVFREENFVADNYACEVFGVLESMRISVDGTAIKGNRVYSHSCR